MAPLRIPLHVWLGHIAASRGLRYEFVHVPDERRLAVYICPGDSVTWEEAGRYDLDADQLTNYRAFQVTLAMMGYPERKLARA